MGHIYIYICCHFYIYIYGNIMKYTHIHTAKLKTVSEEGRLEIKTKWQHTPFSNSSAIGLHRHHLHRSRLF